MFLPMSHQPSGRELSVGTLSYWPVYLCSSPNMLVWASIRPLTNSHRTRLTAKSNCACLNLGNSETNGKSGTYDALSEVLSSVWSGQRHSMFLKLLPRRVESGPDVARRSGLAPFMRKVPWFLLSSFALASRPGTKPGKGHRGA